MSQYKMVNGKPVLLTEEEKALALAKAERRRLKDIEELSSSYKQLREKEYPSIENLIVALWEYIVEGDPTEKEILQAKRLLVKQRHPKPKEL